MLVDISGTGPGMSAQQEKWLRSSSAIDISAAMTQKLTVQQNMPGTLLTCLGPHGRSCTQGQCSSHWAVFGRRIMTFASPIMLPMSLLPLSLIHCPEAQAVRRRPPAKVKAEERTFYSAP